MRNVLILLLAVTCMHDLSGQHIAESAFKPQWNIRLNAGIGAFISKGISPSRNQLNYESADAGSAFSYKQESQVASLALEAGLYRNLKNNMRLGILINTFKDDDEYLGSSDIQASVAGILNDSLSNLTIYNYQSYANIGVSYEYDWYFKSGSRHKLSLALSVGLSINRTPDRTEFDLFAERNYVNAPSVSGTGDWFITHTRFTNGLFIMPSIVYGFELTKNQAIHFSLATSFHRLSTESQVSLLDENSSGSLDRKPYSIRSTQIKIAYSFNL